MEGFLSQYIVTHGYNNNLLLFSEIWPTAHEYISVVVRTLYQLGFRCFFVIVHHYHISVKY